MAAAINSIWLYNTSFATRMTAIIEMVTVNPARAKGLVMVTSSGKDVSKEPTSVRSVSGDPTTDIAGAVVRL